MHYNIIINQKAIIDSGLIIDLTDAAILDFMFTFSAAEKITKLTYGGHQFCYFSYQKIVEELPIIALGRDAIYRRLKRMSEIGLIQAHPENQIMQKPFYRLTERALDTRRFKTDPSAPAPDPLRIENRSPTDETPDNNNTINNKHKDNMGEPTVPPLPVPEIISYKNISYKRWTAEQFKQSIRDARERRKNNLKEKPFSRDDIMAFFNWWSEPDAKGEMRFQKQATWATLNRLVTWQSRN